VDRANTETRPVVINGYQNVFNTKNYRTAYGIPTHFVTFYISVDKLDSEMLSHEACSGSSWKDKLEANMNKMQRISGALRQKVHGDE
jgi:hypothetical protein